MASATDSTLSHERLELEAEGRPMANYSDLYYLMPGHGLGELFRLILFNALLLGDDRL